MESGAAVRICNDPPRKINFLKQHLEYNKPKYITGDVFSFYKLNQEMFLFIKVKEGKFDRFYTIIENKLYNQAYVYRVISMNNELTMRHISIKRQDEILKEHFADYYMGFLL